MDLPVNRRLVVLGLVVTALAATGARAETGDEITEILVTSRKKEENLLEVPVAITAFTADAIEKSGIRDLYDVAELTPGLSFFNAQGEFLAVPVIRGVAPTDIFGENNAAIFVDGVYVSGREGLNFSQLDVERIEVVKGPQSALYGRNAFSGAINYVTRKPTPEFEAKADVTVGNDGRQGGQASVGGPIFGEALMGRISALYDDFGGSYDNVLGGQDIGGYRYRSFQGSLLWKAAENLSVAGAIYYSNDDIDDAVVTGVPANCENNVDNNLAEIRLLNVCGRLQSLDELAGELRGIGTPVALENAAYYAGGSLPVVPGATGEDRELTRAHLTVDWDLGFGSLTFLTGYSETTQSALVDGNRGLGDNTPYVFCSAAFGVVCPGPFQTGLLTAGLLQIEQEDSTDEFSQEIRFTSPQDRRFRYSAGAYYYDVTADTGDGGVEITGTPPPPVDQLFGPFLLPPAPAIAIGDTAFRPWFQAGGDLDPLARTVLREETDSWSLFASAEFDLTDRLTVDAQVRYGEEDKSVASVLWDEQDLDAPDPLDFVAASQTFDAWTGRLGLKFQLSDSWIVYTSIANGEKSGGYDVNSVTFQENPDSPDPDNAPCDLAETSEVEPCDKLTAIPFDSETILATEIGIKGTTADGRLFVDLAIYQNKWDDITIPQAFDADPFTNQPYEQPETFNGNPGDATVVGWDLEIGYQVTENLSLRATGSFTDAEYDSGRQASYETFPSFRPSDCQGQTTGTSTDLGDEEIACRAASGNLAGQTVLRQPEWQASLGANYVRALTGDWDFFAGGDASYQGSLYIGNDNQSELPAHTYVNLRIGVESARYTIELWGRNVFDDDAPIAAYRDVYFNNTDDIYQESPPQSSPADFFPWRYTVSHPRLATYGITGRVRFGAAER